jgi:hypothetical protein
MTDHLVTLPQHYQYVYQFAKDASNERCAEACMAMVGQIAFPGRWQNPVELMHELYTHYVGPDTPTDRKGTTKAQVLDWLSKEGIGHIDMSPFLNDLDNFKHEIQAQNAQSVCQILTVDDMSKLRYAKNNGLLYDWKGGGAGASHVILRVGYSDDQGYGLYFDPAADPSFKQSATNPLAISWQSILEAGIFWACAIMSYHVDVPPAGFSYQHETWPKPPAPKPAPEDVLAHVRAQVQAERLQTHSLLEQLRSQVEQVEAKEDAAFLDTLRQLGANV